VREAESPSSDGQWVVVEDESGARWRVECLGEPVAVGARLAFEAVSDRAPRGRSARAGLGQGQMVRLLTERRREWVCTLHETGQGLTLVPFGGREAVELSLARRDARGAEEGDRVVVAPLARKSGRPRRKPRGAGRVAGIPVRVVVVLGPAGDPEADYRALVWKHHLTTDFPRRARLEADAIEEPRIASEIGRRLDLRELPFVTIDPASARDHDDAVFAEERAPETLELVAGARAVGGTRRRRISWTRRLWVAIADVAHFVAPGGALDSEARRRGNSFYFPDRAIPMLPDPLSSGVCSLVPDADRLAMVVELRIASDGRVADALFHEAVIRSHARLSYAEAAEWLASPLSKRDADPIWGPSLRCLDRIATDLLQARRAAGAILLELPELAVRVDDEGRPIDCAVRIRNRAHVVIEEAMLAANRAVATALDRAKRPTLHRVHPSPTPQKLATLSVLLDRLSLREEADLADPHVLASIVERTKGTRFEERVHTAVLRSMSQARYVPDSQGHYALQFDHYVHFTSPIRRYADLEVHRTLKRLIRSAPEEAPREGLAFDRLERLAIWLSGRERLAIDVERDADDLACCAILRGRVGERFSAKVIGATAFGLFVRLDSPAASGLIPIRTLDGYWVHDPDEEALVAERSGSRFDLGDVLEVELVEVDSDRGRLGFRLARDARGGSRERRGGRGSREKEGSQGRRRGRERPRSQRERRTSSSASASQACSHAP
jgi:ribonuclease R